MILDGYRGGPPQWRGGSVYDPQTGDETYDSTLTLVSPDTLKVEGLPPPVLPLRNLDPRERKQKLEDATPEEDKSSRESDWCWAGEPTSHIKRRRCLPVASQKDYDPFRLRGIGAYRT